MFQNQHQAAHQRQTQLGVNPGDSISFADLPPEIQLKIWKHAAFSQPRVIELKICEQFTGLNENIPEGPSLEYQTPTGSIPTLLLKICHESRDIVQKSYKYTTFLGRPLCYDPDIDILWVRGKLVFPTTNFYHMYRVWGHVGALFEEKHQLPTGPYLFRSVALDFARLKESHQDFPVFAQGAPDFRVATLYGLSRTEVEKIYIVYSLGDPRDEVDLEVQDFIDKLNSLHCHPWINRFLNGTNLTEWTAPSVEAILDTELMRGTNNPT
ncbi:hypothetical protein MFRU_031g00300 [Monilinia fructicola]|uniref:2EXR domain-containing protein n=1 Tax=Monilinia fructicola TaxID=38448 RepID=A0A5M9JRU9_MONFR|nr:hypothetical protein EYC84_002818 [Monilinia fructicola]KAG4027281.1 hypothetical protein MFRU_031g00300 [Monilinia fructicola]